MENLFEITSYIHSDRNDCSTVMSLAFEDEPFSVLTSNIPMLSLQHLNNLLPLPSLQCGCDLCSFHYNRPAAIVTLPH